MNGCPVEGLREGPGHRHRQAPRRPVLRLPVLHAGVPVRRAEVQHAARASSASATCAATGWPWARRRRACRRARTRRSRSSVVDKQRVARGRARRPRSCPARPPAITLPTTDVQDAKRPFPRNLLPADYYRVRRRARALAAGRHAGAHAAVGGRVRRRARARARAGPAARRRCAARARTRVVALGARPARARRPACFHLGRPLYAFRAVLGLRHSWLSREIVAFGAFAGSASPTRRTLARAVAGGAALPPLPAGWRAAAALLGGGRGGGLAACSAR